MGFTELSNACSVCASLLIELWPTHPWCRPYEVIDVRMKLGPSPSRTTRGYLLILLAIDTDALIQARNC
jgi:hypothetical protein